MNNDRKIDPGPALYILATPIGNLEDITLRALRILREVDLIVSEDTRKTTRLLREYDIHTPLKSYRAGRLNEDTRRTIHYLKNEKKNIAFCSEAGTPGISDPGSLLVRSVKAELPDIPLLPIPGPNAMVSAMSVSGFQTNPALYLGFLSPKGGRRRKILSKYSDFEGIIIIYESVHRITKTLTDIREIFRDRSLFYGREMTKMYEEYKYLKPWSEKKNEDFDPLCLTEKGEFTLVIGPKREKG